MSSERRAYRPDLPTTFVRGQPPYGQHFYDRPWQPPQDLPQRMEPHGRFAGVGPKNFRRADERIRDDVCVRFTHNEYLDPRDIEVQVKNGEVTLTGDVEDRLSKVLAEDLADEVPGVRDVHNRLKIRNRLATGMVSETVSPRASQDVQSSQAQPSDSPHH